MAPKTYDAIIKSRVRDCDAFAGNETMTRVHFDAIEKVNNCVRSCNGYVPLVLLAGENGGTALSYGGDFVWVFGLPPRPGLLVLLTAATDRTPSRAMSCMTDAAFESTPAGCSVVYCLESGESTDLALVASSSLTTSIAFAYFSLSALLHMVRSGVGA